MLSLSELKTKFKFVIDIEYFDFRTGGSFQYSKYLLILKDDLKLYVTEFVSLDDRSYSYHLQDANNELIQRWDNSKHHPELATFPHYTHLKDQVLPSHEITLQDILAVISQRFE